MIKTTIYRQHHVFRDRRLDVDRVGNVIPDYGVGNRRDHQKASRLKDRRKLSVVHTQEHTLFNKPPPLSSWIELTVLQPCQPSLHRVCKSTAHKLRGDIVEVDEQTASKLPPKHSRPP